MGLFKALTDPSFEPNLEQAPAYFMSLSGYPEQGQRFDKHRLLVIAMANLFRDLIEKQKEQVGQAQCEALRGMLRCFYLAFEEYCLMPVINQDRTAGHELTLTTPVVEFIFTVISLAMAPEYTFTKSNRAVNHFSMSASVAA